jgi:8-oxo-dGTP pyrophosphatase MutT (NUDIX family)
VASRREEMAEGERDLSEYRRVIAGVLGSIPTHNEQPETVAQLADTVFQRFGSLPPHDLESIVASILSVLGAFDVLNVTNGRYRARAEMPVYFLRSLAWYVGNGRTVVSHWTRRGVGEPDPSIKGLLDAAPYLLRVMEARRLQLGGAGVEPTRRERVVFVLVKTVVEGRVHLLFEWDRAAAQYQLIGGRIGDEAPETAAAQEFIEEMDVDRSQRLEEGRDFEIRRLDWDRPPPLQWAGISQTVGALTHYQVWAFSVHLRVPQLRLGEQHRWLTIGEVLEGRTASGRRTGDPALFRLMNASLTGGLEHAPVSVGIETIPNFRSGSDLEMVKVFIGHGHSPAWRELADHLRDQHGCRVDTFESAPRAGRTISDILTEMAKQASFAILVHTAEDEQADGGQRARQNVVHETGLFQGRLGISRAIVLRQRGCEDFSNIAGVQELHYSHEIREAFGEVVAVLRREFPAMSR